MLARTAEERVARPVKWNCRQWRHAAHCASGMGYAIVGRCRGELGTQSTVARPIA
jgi:hypothetical protein